MLFPSMYLMASFTLPKVFACSTQHNLGRLEFLGLLVTPHMPFQLRLWRSISQSYSAISLGTVAP